METSDLRQTKSVAPRVGTACKAFDPTQLFAQRDRLPWFWFLVAVAVTVSAAVDRYRIINQFKQRERVVIIDPSQTYYISPLLQFQEARDLHIQQAELATTAFLERSPKDFDHLDLLKQIFLKGALQKRRISERAKPSSFAPNNCTRSPRLAGLTSLQRGRTRCWPPFPGRSSAPGSSRKRLSPRHSISS